MVTPSGAGKRPEPGHKPSLDPKKSSEKINKAAEANKHFLAKAKAVGKGKKGGWGEGEPATPPKKPKNDHGQCRKFLDQWSGEELEDKDKKWAYAGEQKNTRATWPKKNNLWTPTWGTQ